MLTAAANLDDIISAFSKLDESSDIPPIFCEALDLVHMPPVVADLISEKILTIWLLNHLKRRCNSSPVTFQFYAPACLLLKILILFCLQLLGSYSDAVTVDNSATEVKPRLASVPRDSCSSNLPYLC